MIVATRIASMKRGAGCVFICFLAISAAFAWCARNAEAGELIMVRQLGCSWCARWDNEVGAKYPSTGEGRAAPLREVRLGDPLPPYIRKPVTVTPTFILVDDGREVDRIVGYPGESFFWEMLEQMLSQISSSRAEEDLKTQPQASVAP